MTSVQGARSLALEALLEIERGTAFADEVLDQRFSRAKLDGRDRALAFELVYGVLRHKTTLDWRLTQVSNRPIERLPRLVATALRLAAYQLLFLERIPQSAAVNESVTLVKSMRPARGAPARDWSGFVNAVLRSLIREPAPPWPDPSLDPVAALAIRHSCPSWLAERWVARLGTERAETLCRATLTVPPLTIRTNCLRTTREALAESLSQAGHIVTPTQVSPIGLVLEKCGPVADLPQFRDGLFYVEDEAGQLVAPLLDPQPGERVLDACAAPGGKATHLAALMQNRGEIVAMDRRPTRLRRVDENCRRMGIQFVSTVAADATQDEGRLLTTLFERPFDRILLDAPCSGLGVLRRHPEGKWQKAEEGLTAQQMLQHRLIENVSRLLRPGGVLVYSTCSTEPDENEDVVERFCQHHAEFRRESVAPWLPDSGRDLLTAQGHFSTLLNSHSMDVFFAARLRKAEP
ncbi:MAG: 16S rRNA (cytosine(967)-C(5))-methyltransferase RsmB [Nitrospira sp.]|nr:16S rRNA (cytosine(967)-C(5))-methyltransferase RsmB [Nitrospira sp.]